MPYYMGIDIGSGTSKGLLRQNGSPVASYSLLSGVNYRLSAEKLRDELLKQAKLTIADIACIAATGQGSGLVGYANQKVADIRCCARGINSIFPEVRTVIDVEGQSTQVIRTDGNGQVVNFIISEKCASGAGRFLDIISNVLQIPLSELGPLSLKSKNPVVFTTACAVFGESEAVSRVSEGVPREDIVAGVHKALAEKIASLVGRIGLEEKCAICGGGALNIGLVEWVQTRLGIELLVPPQPQFITALGAAIIAEEMAQTEA
ncbi:MAG: acyl-CoA dehydratase activase [Dehalococcoidales bacterium]|nr:acyl-CoA dehydratase activase [Dehalococcoidales bacterium]